MSTWNYLRRRIYNKFNTQKIISAFLILNHVQCETVFWAKFFCFSCFFWGFNYGHCVYVACTSLARWDGSFIPRKIESASTLSWTNQRRCVYLLRFWKWVSSCELWQLARSSAVAVLSFHASCSRRCVRLLVREGVYTLAWRSVQCVHICSLILD